VDCPGRHAGLPQECAEQQPGLELVIRAAVRPERMLSGDFDQRGRPLAAPRMKPTASA
jgi:hypothetical protein